MIKGKLWKQKVEKVTDLNYQAKDKLIRVTKLDEGILTKAEVIEVKGIICLETEDCHESEIPIKKVSEDEWKKLG
jgi:hypothetical protein